MCRTRSRIVLKCWNDGENYYIIIAKRTDALHDGLQLLKGDGAIAVGVEGTERSPQVLDGLLIKHHQK